MNRLLFCLPLALAACSGGDGTPNANRQTEIAEAPPIAQPNSVKQNGTGETPAPADTPLNPPEPGEPGGLPDDRTPVSEAPFTPESAQGAANVLQTYYALIEKGEYDEAFALREPSTRGPSAEDFAASFDRYAEYHAHIGAPSDIEGAAGSLYVEVPVQTYGRLKDGQPFSNAGTVTLRRSNNVPGSTAAQRRWRIYTSG
jgi:hypothetical protein